MASKSKEEIADKRMSICNRCEHKLVKSNSCGKCGCNLSAKTLCMECTCPVGRW